MMWSGVHHQRGRCRCVWRPRQSTAHRPWSSSSQACGDGCPRPRGTTANDSCLVSCGGLWNTRRTTTRRESVESSPEITSDHWRRSAYLEEYRCTLRQIPNQEAGGQRKDELADGTDAGVQSEAARAVVRPWAQAFGACQDLPMQARPGIALRVRPRPRRELGLQNAGGDGNANGYPREAFLGGNHVFTTDGNRIDALDGHVSAPATDLRVRPIRLVATAVRRPSPRLSTTTGWPAAANSRTGKEPRR